MSKRELRVGERVRAFGVSCDDGHFWSLDGTVESLNPPGPMIYVKCDGAFPRDSILVHQKQCRRLIRRERRRIWVNPGAVFSVATEMACRPVEGWTEYREVPKKGGAS